MEDNSSNEIELQLVLLLALARRQRKKAQNVGATNIYFKKAARRVPYNLLQEMRLSDPESHIRYLRISRERFDSLLAEVYTRYKVEV